MIIKTSTIRLIVSFGSLTKIFFPLLSKAFAQTAVHWCMEEKATVLNSQLRSQRRDSCKENGIQIRIIHSKEWHKQLEIEIL